MRPTKKRPKIIQKYEKNIMIITLLSKIISRVCFIPSLYVCVCMKYLLIIQQKYKIDFSSFSQKTIDDQMYKKYFFGQNYNVSRYEWKLNISKIQGCICKVNFMLLQVMECCYGSSLQLLYPFFLNKESSWERLKMISLKKLR